MPPAIVHFDSIADCQEAWREAMLMGTAEAIRKKYPEAEITTTAATDRRACCHSKHIPEARPEMMGSFLNRLTAARRRTQTQARLHATSDHEGKMANRAVQLIAGRLVFRAEGFRDLAFRHRGCWEKSIPSAFTPDDCDPPAVPASDT